MSKKVRTLFDQQISSVKTDDWVVIQTTPEVVKSLRWIVKAAASDVARPELTVMQKLGSGWLAAVDGFRCHRVKLPDEVFAAIPDKAFMIASIIRGKFGAIILASGESGAKPEFKATIDKFFKARPCVRIAFNSRSMMKLLSGMENGFSNMVTMEIGSRTGPILLRSHSETTDREAIIMPMHQDGYSFSKEEPQAIDDAIELANAVIDGKPITDALKAKAVNFLKMTGAYVSIRDKEESHV